MKTDVTNRWEAMLLFDVAYGNPNGDPAGDNKPRTDLETRKGLVTDACLKRKIRDYVIATRNEPGLEVLIKKGESLNSRLSAVYKNAGIKGSDKKESALAPQKRLAAACTAFFDVRAFGAVLASKEEPGAAGHGPIQFGMSTSVDPVTVMRVQQSRVVETNAPKGKGKAKSKKAKSELEEDFEVESGDSGDEAEEHIPELSENGTFGTKWVIPYGLYVCKIQFNPHSAAKSGLSSEDLAVFWEAVQGMFSLDVAGGRALNLQQVIHFQHASPRGNAHAHQLFRLVNITRNADVVVPRDFLDYTITVGAPPDGVEVSTLF